MGLMIAPHGCQVLRTRGQRATAEACAARCGSCCNLCWNCQRGLSHEGPDEQLKPLQLGESSQELPGSLASPT